MERSTGSPIEDSAELRKFVLMRECLKAAQKRLEEEQKRRDELRIEEEKKREQQRKK